jgi:hypothetical protein
VNTAVGSLEEDDMKSTLACLAAAPLAVLALVVSATEVSPQALDGGTPLPTATGPIPVTADSYPQLGVERIQERVDLAAAGYVEEEFFVSGEGNAYDWAADGSVSVQFSKLPYTTRVIVRRPADAARFNGNVVVELLNNSRSYDWPMAWSVVHPYVMESGAAYVGITIRPRGLDSLKMFNPARYDALSFAAPAQPCANDASADRREDLHWDIVSQVGALLKTARRSGPLAGFDVERLYAISDDDDLPTYVNAIHAHANMADGRSIYDGYLYKGNPYPTRINACAAAPGPNDPRRRDRGANVPVVRLLTEGDAVTSFTMRREDSDAPGDLYRLYEVAGTSHMDASFYRHLPLVEDQVKMGQPPFLSAWPLAYKCDIDIPMQDSPLYRYAVNAALENVDRWVRDGIPAPRAERIAVRNGGTEKAEFVFDEFGNAVGGVRSPYLDVPVATYHAKTPGPGVCRNLLNIERFDWTKLESLYGSHAAYAAKLAESVERIVQQRFLTKADAERILRDSAVPDAGGK